MRCSSSRGCSVRRFPDRQRSASVPLQRVWIALLAKGVPFDKHEIDLRDSSGMATVKLPFAQQSDGWP